MMTTERFPARSGTAWRLLLIAGCILWMSLAYADDEAAAAGDTDDGIDVKGATLGRMGDPIAVDPNTFEFADAEVKLWLDNHLQNINSPGGFITISSSAGVTRKVSAIPSTWISSR